MKANTLGFVMVGVLAFGCKQQLSSASLVKDDTQPAGPTSSNADATKGDSAPSSPDAVPDSDFPFPDDDPTLDLEECSDDACSSSVPLDLTNLLADNSAATDTSVLSGTDGGDPSQNAFALDTITKGLTVTGTVFQSIGASVDVDAIAKATVGASFTGQATLTGDIHVTRDGTVAQLPAFVTEKTVKAGDTMAVNIGFGVQGTFTASVSGGVSIVVAKAQLNASRGLSLGASFTAGYSRTVTADEDGKTVVALLSSDLSKLQGAVVEAAQKWFNDNAQTIKDALASQQQAVQASSQAATDAGRGAGNDVYNKNTSLLSWKACYKYDSGWGIGGTGQQGCIDSANANSPNNFDAYYNACFARVDELCKG